MQDRGWKILASLLSVFMTLQAFGEIPADSVKVYFRVGQHALDPEHSNSHAVMDSFINSVYQAEAEDNIERIIVIGYGAQDSVSTANERLSLLDSENIADYIAQHVGDNRFKIQTIAGDIELNELRRMIEENPDLGNAVAVSAYFTAEPDYRKSDQNIKATVYNNLPNRTLIINDTIETIVTTYITENNATDPTPITATTEYYKDSAAAIHRFALKSNVLYDAALLPNLELEWMINRNWSVAVEGDLAWWKDAPKHRYYELAMVSLEGRRWFAVKKPWHGFYAGVFAGIGKYDLENKDKGYQGEGGMAGVSIGYMFPIGKSFSLEAGLGAGYLHTKYKEYYPIDEHYVYQRTKSLNYFGPLKLKLAIAWRFYNTNKRKQTTAP